MFEQFFSSFSRVQFFTSVTEAQLFESHIQMFKVQIPSTIGAIWMIHEIRQHLAYDLYFFLIKFQILEFS